MEGIKESTADHVGHAVVSRRGTGRRPKKGPSNHGDKDDTSGKGGEG